MYLAVCSVLLAAVPAVAAENLDAAASSIRAAFDKHNTLKAQIGIAASLPIGTQRIAINGEGLLFYAKRDGAAKYRQQLTLQMPDPLRMEVGLQAVYDGSRLQVSQQILGQTQTNDRNNALAQGAFPPGGGLLMDLLEKEFDLKRLPDARIEGESVFVLEGMPKPNGAPAPYVRMLASVDQATGVLRELQLFESDGVVTVTITQGKIELNPDLSKETFTLPPSGAPPAPITIPTGAAGGGGNT
jgi:outer membrane lipoprotein-sorting protein